MKVTKVLQKPLITEKSVIARKANDYVFRVNMQATKGGIADEIEKTFGVNVVDVHTIIVPGKKRRRAKTHVFIKTEKWKKAIVKLKEGQTIDIFPKE